MKATSKKRDVITLTKKDFRKAAKKSATATLTKIAAAKDTPPTVKKAAKEMVQEIKKAPKNLVSRFGKALVEAFELFKTGAKRASELAGELKLPRGKVRKAFRDMAGGKDAYAKIMSGFAPVLPPRNGGGGRKKGDPAQLRLVDDSKVKRVMPKERRKWNVTLENNHKNAIGKPYSLYTAPDGTQYREAHPLAQADVIIVFENSGNPKDVGLRNTRLVKISEKVQKQLKKKAAEAEKARKERKSAKQAKKAASRKARKASKKSK